MPLQPIYKLNLVANIATTGIASNVKVVQVEGYHTQGVGGFMMQRVAVQPTHLWRFRSLDRFLPNGAVSALNGGWWEGYPPDGLNLYIEQFGAKADYDEVGATGTDDYPAFAAAISYIADKAPEFTPTYRVVGFALNLARTTSYISQTVAFEYIVAFGGMASINGDFGVTCSKLVFPINTAGLIFWNWSSSPGGQSASGTLLRGFTVQSQPYGIFGSPTGWDGVLRSGIEIHAQVRFDSVSVDGFGGHGIYILGYGPDVPPIPPPQPITGSGDSQMCIHGEVSRCAGDGLRVEGSDANASTFLGFILSDNSRWGLNENSQLGNTHIQHTCTGNGNPGDPQAKWNQCCLVWEAGIEYLPWPQGNTVDGFVADDLAVNRPSTSPNEWYAARTAVDIGFVHWGQVLYLGVVYDVVPGQEANMWTSQPNINPAVWTAGGAPTPGYYYITWVMNWRPYVCGGDIGSLSEVGYSTFLNIYHEPIFGPDFPPSFYHGNSIAIGGQSMSYVAPNSSGVVMRSNGGLEVMETNIHLVASDPKQGNFPIWDLPQAPALHSYLGGPGNNAPIFTWNYGGSNDYCFHGINDVGGVKTDFALDYANSQKIYVITGIDTTYTFGRGVAQPLKITIDAGIFLGPGDNGRNITYDEGEPALGLHAEGDLYLNNFLSLTGKCSAFGWRNTTTGEPGTWEKLFAVSGDAFTVATLPAASADLKGARAFVTDATAPTWLGVLVGGGAVVCPVFCNGSAWVSG